MIMIFLKGLTRGKNAATGIRCSQNYFWNFYIDVIVQPGIFGLEPSIMVSHSRLVMNGFENEIWVFEWFLKEKNDFISNLSRLTLKITNWTDFQIFRHSIFKKIPFSNFQMSLKMFGLVKFL